MPLTNTSIRNAKPNGKTQRLFDGGGLYLELSPKGGKWWRQKYRFNGREKRISHGVYPDVSLKQARDRRDDARRLLADGIDPSEQRKTNKFQTLTASKNSFEVVALEWHSKKKPTWSEIHADKIIRLLKRDIFPWLGRRPISEISASELLTNIRRIEDRGAIDTSHRALNICGQIFRYAIATASVSLPSSLNI